MSGKDLQFSFNFETEIKILAEIHNLDKKKACQNQSIYFMCKSIDWLLYEGNTGT